MKKAESDQIVIALRDRGFPVEYLVAPDEGHGFARPVNNMAMFAAAEKFLAKHLGGRFQEGGTPEVVGAPEGDHGRPEDGRPREEGRRGGGRRAEAGRRPRAPARSSYAGYDRGRRRRRCRSRSTHDDQGGGRHLGRHRHARRRRWARRSTRRRSTRATLVPLKRVVKQGPVVDRARVRGRQGHRARWRWAAEPKPVSVDLGGPLFADGAGAHARRSPRCRSPRATPGDVPQLRRPEAEGRS